MSGTTLWQTLLIRMWGQNIKVFGAGNGRNVLFVVFAAEGRKTFWRAVWWWQHNLVPSLMTKDKVKTLFPFLDFFLQTYIWLREDDYFWCFYNLVSCMFFLGFRAVLFQLPRLREDLRLKALRLAQQMCTIIGKFFDIIGIWSQVAKFQTFYTRQIPPNPSPGFSPLFKLFYDSFKKWSEMI